MTQGPGNRRCNWTAEVLLGALLIMLFALAAEAYYAETLWPTIHADSRNSDFAPISAPRLLKVEWTALDGSAIIGSVTIGPEGHRYVTTGKGIGFSNLHAFGRDGNHLWSSGPVVDMDDLDPLAVGSSAIVDSAGDIYISDFNQFWAFHPDGTIKWIVPIPVNFATAFFTKDGYVGGITVDGEVVIVDRDDGELAAEIITIPGEALPLPPTPPGLWKDMMAEEIIPYIFGGLLGCGLKVTNTPAVNPKNGLIYVPVAASELAAPPGPASMGKFYGIKFTPPNRRKIPPNPPLQGGNFGSGGSLEIAFETPMGSGGATSPVISPDFARVYAADAAGNLYAFDADTGAIQWTLAIGSGSALASPSIGHDGRIYLASGGAVYAIADRGTRGKILWSIDYTGMASQYLPAISDSHTQLPLCLAVKADSVISVTYKCLYVVFNLGYRTSIPEYEREFFVPMTTLLTILDKDNGSLAGLPVLLADTCEGVISIGSNKEIYVTHASMERSIAYHTLNPYLPAPLRVLPPIGGISALTQRFFSTGALSATTVPTSDTGFAVEQNYPNPFNPETWIPYSLGADCEVNINIYDPIGRLIRSLSLGYQPAGFYTNKEKAAYWDGRNEVGEQVASGIYFYTIQAGDSVATRKMTVTR